MEALQTADVTGNTADLKLPLRLVKLQEGTCYIPTPVLLLKPNDQKRLIKGEVDDEFLR